jgi:hypothetical protein
VSIVSTTTMSWNDITQDTLVRGSIGVEGEEHDSPTCTPLTENGIYIRNSRNIGNLVVCFRNCKCGKYNRAECERVLEQFQISTIPLPTDGVDIHRDHRCYYSDVPQEKIIRQGNRQRKVYIFPLHCVCKTRPRTAMLNR